MTERETGEMKLLLELELNLSEKERELLMAEARKLTDVPVVVVPEPQLARRPDLHFALALDPIVPSLVAMAINARDLISIVRILLEIARARKKGPHQIEIKSAYGSVKIPGDMPIDAEVTIDQFRTTARIFRNQDAVREIEKIKLRQLDKSIKAAKGSIEMYENFAREFPVGRDLNDPQRAKLRWAEEMLQEYRKKLNQLEHQKLSS